MHQQTVKIFEMRVIECITSKLWQDIEYVERLIPIYFNGVTRMKHQLDSLSDMMEQLMTYHLMSTGNSNGLAVSFHYIMENKDRVDSDEL